MSIDKNPKKKYIKLSLYKDKMEEAYGSWKRKSNKRNNISNR